MSDTLIYWQNNQAAAHWMVRSFIDDGDYMAAIYWQEYAAYCWRCVQSNAEMLARQD